ncbi:MAG: hypothetical protein AAGF31_13075, partial [Planctomycetota bacterium]
MIPHLPLANLSLWVTPLWMLALGVAIGAAILFILWAILWLINRKAASSAIRLVQESVLGPISYVVLAYLAILVVATPVVETDQIFQSLKRLGSVGEDVVNLRVPERTVDFAGQIVVGSDEVVGCDITCGRDR